MNEHSRDDPFAHIQPVDPEEFEFAVRKGTEAGRYRAPMRGPGTRRVKIVDDEEDSETSYTFADTPMNRFMFAIVDEYRGDLQKSQAIVARFSALNNLGAEGHLKEWTQPDEDQPEVSLIHPAVIEVAATASLNPQGEFDAVPFLERVAAIAAEKYPNGIER